MNKLTRRPLGVLILLVIGSIASGANAETSNLHQHSIIRADNEASAEPVDAVFHGELVDDPCIIAPGNETQEVDLQSRESTFFYTHADNPVTTPIPFKLILSECDLTLGKGVKISLIGTPDPDLPELLKIDGTAKGIAIGLDSTQGGVITPMPINQPAVNYELLSGENTLTFQAYLKGKKDDIENKTIEEGDYSAVVEFGLEYE